MNHEQQEILKQILFLKTNLKRFPRFAVLLVAFNNAKQLVRVIERIPREIYDLLEEIFIFDDFSQDGTPAVAREFVNRAMLQKINIFSNPRSYGYGGNQKLGYEYALAKGYDFVILLHGDGKYAPEYLPDFILAALRHKKQVIIGSRFIPPQRALREGMPGYKFLANRVLTMTHNAFLGLSLSEYFCGYRLYGSDFLQKINFKLNSDDFDFDTQIILQAHRLKEPILEVSVPTYYDSEIERKKGIRYIGEVLHALWLYRMHLLGISRREQYEPILPVSYELKNFSYSSHRQILKSVRPGEQVLDLGCGEGVLAREIGKNGCQVTGVDVLPAEHVLPVFDGYLQWDLENPLGWPLRRDFDCVILGDIIEHLKDEKTLMRNVRQVLKEDGRLIISTPNIALWLYRILHLFGRFEYADKGIMDRTHVRFYSLKTLRNLLKSTGFHILNERFTTIPFHLLITSTKLKRMANVVNFLYFQLVRIWPTLFAYQFVLTAQIVRLEWREMRLPQSIDNGADETRPHGNDKAAAFDALRRETAWPCTVAN